MDGWRDWEQGKFSILAGYPRLFTDEEKKKTYNSMWKNTSGYLRDKVARRTKRFSAYTTPRPLSPEPPGMRRHPYEMQGTVFSRELKYISGPDITKLRGETVSREPARSFI